MSRWRVLMGSIYNTPIRKNIVIAEVKTIVYHSSYLPFVDANIDDNSRDIAVLALTKPLQFTGEFSSEQQEIRSPAHSETSLAEILLYIDA